MIYVICGPTGSGKTSASLQIAESLHAPIINGDAFQVYRHMDIGTAKISKSDPFYLRHYLLDIVDPDQTFSVKEYQTMFRQTVAQLQKNNQDIIVCGGTGLYIRASLYDYVFEEEEEDDTSDLEKLSDQELWDELKRIDYDASQSIHFHNRKRVIRALSIARRGGLTKSENIARQVHSMVYPSVRVLLINPPREELYQRINQRVDDMFREGLVEEVQNLLKSYTLSTTARQAIGYKEVIDYLQGKLSLEECQEDIKKRTRNYAKRQITFFKHQFESEKFISGNDLVKAVIK